MRRHTLPLALLALAASVGPLAAQSGQRAPERPNRAAARAADGAPDRARARTGPVANRMGRRATNPAAALLRLRAQLLLTDAQVAQLTALSTAAIADRPERSSESLRMRADLRDAMSGDDPAAARAALDQLSATRNARIVEGMTARKAALDVLTAEQRVKARRMVTRVAQNARKDRPRADRPRGDNPRADRLRPEGRMGRDRGPSGPR